jgi:hypothetical protein
MVDTGLLNNFFARGVFGHGSFVRRILYTQSHATNYSLNTYKFKMYFVARLPMVRYPMWNRTRSKPPFRDTFIEEERCHHGDKRLWPLPWHVA